MRQKAILAAIAALMMASSAPASAAGVKQVSVHTTDSDFNSAERLDGLTVSGSGESAEVVFEQTERFQTETWTTPGGHTETVPAGADEAILEVWGAQGGDGESGGSGGLGGYSKGNLSVSPGEKLHVAVGAAGTTGGDGGNRLNFRGDGGGCSCSGTDESGAGGDASNIRYNGEGIDDRIIVGGGGGGGAGAPDYGDGGGGGDGGGLQGNDGGVPNSDSYDPGEGGTQTGGGDGAGGRDAYNEDGAEGKDNDDGYGDGGGGGGGYYGGGGGGQAADFDAGATGGGGGSGYVNSMLYDTSMSTGVNGGDGQVKISYPITISSATYISANHTAEDASAGYTDMELQDTEAKVTWQGWTGSGWTNVSQNTYTSGGNRSTSLSAGYTKWRLVVEFQGMSDTATGSLQEEGITADTSDPVQSGAQPQSENINNENVELSVDIADGDFSRAQGDSVEARFFVNGSQVASLQTGSNGTVSGVAGGMPSGSHSWYVVTEDSYGNEITSSTFQFTVVHRAPVATGLAPAGAVNDENLELNATVGDYDFDETSGDTVTALVYLNGTQIGSEQLTSNGTVSRQVTGLPEGQHNLTVRATDEYGLTSKTVQQFEVVHHTPGIDGQSAAPVGQRDELPTKLSINVSDADFLEDSGDSVVVEFTHNGAVVGTDTVTSNGTASVSGITPVGGTNTWSAVATDEYGKTESTQQFSYRAPSDLEVRNESAPDNLLDTVSTELNFYFDRDSQPDLVETKTTGNGVVDMTGLPTDEPFVVVADAPGFFNRRIFVPSLYESQDIYLLPESANAVQPVLTIVDYTGKYPTESSVVEVQRSINGSWRTVEGDYLGASNEVSVQVAYNERHRVVVTNVDTGESRVLGVFTPTASTITELEIFNIGEVIAQPSMPVVSFEPAVGSLPAADGVPVNVTVNGRTKSIESYTLKAVASNGTVLATASLPSAGDGSVALGLSDYRGQDVTVWANWTASDGTEEQVSREWGVRSRAGSQYSLLAVLTSLDLGETPNGFSSLLTVVPALLVTGYAATSMGSGAAGLLGLAVVAAGAVLGWVPFTWLVAGGASWAVFAGLRNRL